MSEREVTQEDFEQWYLENTEVDEYEDKEKFLALVFFGKLDTLKSFTTLEFNYFVDTLTFHAVICGCGNIEFLDWLEENYSSEKCMLEKDSYVPAKQGKLEVLKWMHNHGYKFNEITLANAVYSGNFKLVKWLCEDAICEIGHDAFGEASVHGHLNILKYLAIRRPQFDSSKCRELAVKQKQTGIVEWIDSLIKPRRSKSEQIKDLLKRILVLLEDL